MADIALTRKFGEPFPIFDSIDAASDAIVKAAFRLTAENGKLCMHVRYGAKTLELAKGKTAIEVGATDNLIPTLDALKAAVAAGELDAQIEAISATLRSGFAATK